MSSFRRWSLPACGIATALFAAALPGFGQKSAAISVQVEKTTAG